MPTYKIRGIDVDFPYEAYDCQIVYMEKVIQSLQERCNALLESPTGTGKTLCLLCAALAWRKSLGGFSTGRSRKRGPDTEGPSSQSESLKLPTILYTSRTHSQIRQVIQELRRTNYRPKMVALGSREQLCIHEEVSLLHGKTQTNACHSLCKKRKKRFCTHFPRVAEFMKSNPGLGDEPIDIEDLVNIGRSNGPCPYYVSRELHKVVDILFAPYNYLIDRGYRKSLSINWESSVLIFDEAHNLESICADAASFDLPSGLLTSCISEAKNCIDLSIARRDKSNDKSSNPDNFAILKALLLKLEKRIAEVPIESKEQGFTRPGPYIYELLADLNITQKTSTMLMDIIEEAAILLEEDATGTESDMPQKTKGTVCRLESIGDILRIIFRDGGGSHAKYYRVHVQELEGSGSDTFKAGYSGKASRTFSWWCFNPGIAMEEFSKLGVGSIILTSGTLSPMDSFADELKLDFPIRLENPHVISDNQVWAGVVPVGPSGYPFNSSYRSRDSIEYKLDLGNAIVNFARIVPDGLLVFFPSYYLMDQCIGFWKTKGPVKAEHSTAVWERICKYKLPVVEPRQSSLFPSAIEDYMSKLKDKSTTGAIFFAVCRGKVSEGLDFADNAGRAVVITGMPFASRNDPRVRLKREFLDHQVLLKQTGPKVLTGEEWYSQQASRAVNQAVGRVIRHRSDYGAIIFCDERFSTSNRQSQISLWIQPHIKCYSKFGDVVFTLTRFFRDVPSSRPLVWSVTRTENQEELKMDSTVQPLDKLRLDKLLSSLTALTDTTCSVESSSSFVDIKSGDVFGQLGKVPPANRSNLTFHKHVQSSTSWSLVNQPFDGNKLIPGRKIIQFSEHEVVDLTTNSAKASEILIAPCSSKKHRISHPKPSESHCERINWRSELENTSSVTDSCDCMPSEMTKQYRSTELVSQESRNFSACPAPCGNEEKGSTFLIQVREKLSDAEYKEFVGFMKALKSKAMKIGHVLQSITKLFSTPDRHPLLLRFKDYIPSKYHSLYEQYLEKYQSTQPLIS